MARPADANQKDLPLVARRLDHLFTTVHPQGRGPYSYAEVAKAINDAAGDNIISHSYIWLLRTGQRDDPGMKRLAALAAFFGVSPLYFFGDAEAERLAQQQELISALRQDMISTIATRANGLSDHSLHAILALIENARTLEGLPAADA